MKEKISAYEKRLREEKEKLTAKIQKYSEVEDFGNDVDHGDEEADESESYGNRMSIASDLKVEVNEIDMRAQLQYFHFMNYDDQVIYMPSFKTTVQIVQEQLRLFAKQ